MEGDEKGAESNSLRWGEGACPFPLTAAILVFAGCDTDLGSGLDDQYITYEFESGSVKGTLNKGLTEYGGIPAFIYDSYTYSFQIVAYETVYTMPETGPVDAGAVDNLSIFLYPVLEGDTVTGFGLSGGDLYLKGGAA